jgi:hypothetical protein
MEAPRGPSPAVTGLLNPVPAERAPAVAPLNARSKSPSASIGSRRRLSGTKNPASAARATPNTARRAGDIQPCAGQAGQAPLVHLPAELLLAGLGERFRDSGVHHLLVTC